MRKIRLVIGVVALVAFGAVSAHASGFAIVEQGVRGLGAAYAGAAALAEDPSTIFYNPAGMVRLKGKRIEVGAHYIAPQAEFKDKGSTHFLGVSLDFHGNDGGDGGEAALVPNLYYTHQLSESLVVGLGIHAPYGLATDYDRNWVGRYHAVESKLSTININPSVAVRLNDKWSVGAGFSFEKADATLSSKADLGLIGVLAGGTPQQDDGFSEVEGDDWGYGANIGFLFEPTQSTRLGLAFRSKVDHKLEGDVKWDYETAFAEAFAQNPLVNAVNGDAEAKVTLPETLSLAGYHAFNDKLAVMADVTYTNWDRMEELRIVYTSGQQDTVVTMDWESTWRYGLGVIWTPNDKCTGRIGVAFDQSPIPSAEKRTPRIPDEDRFWVSLGGAYKFTEKMEFNFAYTHIFVDDPEVNKTATGEDQIRGALVGEWDASVDIVSVNMTYVF
ncbi:MAG: outer membrane protein transport protein [Desulfobacteraceae bacterium]|jgi:long-chain fatty acid transport protein